MQERFTFYDVAEQQINPCFARMTIANENAASELDWRMNSINCSHLDPNFSLL